MEIKLIICTWSYFCVIIHLLIFHSLIHLELCIISLHNSKYRVNELLLIVQDSGMFFCERFWMTFGFVVSGQRQLREWSSSTRPTTAGGIPARGCACLYSAEAAVHLHCRRLDKAVPRREPFDRRPYPGLRSLGQLHVAVHPRSVLEGRLGLPSASLHCDDGRAADEGERHLPEGEPGSAAATCPQCPFQEYMAPLLEAVRNQDSLRAIEWSQSDQWATVEQVIAASSASTSSRSPPKPPATGSLASSLLDSARSVSGHASWTCKICTFMNSGDTITCEMCTSPRYEMEGH